jgi:hypothetical protein
MVGVYGKGVAVTGVLVAVAVAVAVTGVAVTGVLVAVEDGIGVLVGGVMVTFGWLPRA